MEQQREARLAIILLSAAILAFTIITFATALSYHHELKSQAADTGGFFQMLHSLMTLGKPLTTLNIPPTEQHWLAVHFSPILFLLAPLTALFSGFYFLNAINSLGFALAALPIFYACRHMKIPPLQAAGWAALYLINPFVINAAIIDFHEICIAVPLLACGLLCLLKKNPRTLVLCLLFLLTVKEHYGLAWVGFGFAWFFLYREKIFALKLGAFGMATMLAILLLIMPYFAEDREHIGLFGFSMQGARFGWLTELSSAPAILLKATVNGFLYLFILILPFLFLPLKALALLFTFAADFTVNILSSSAYMRSSSAYYSAALIPALVVGSAIGALKLAAKNPKLTTRDALICMLAMGIPYSVGYTNLPLPYFQNEYQLSGFATPWAEGQREAIHDIRRLLTEDDIITATSNLAPWFATKRNIYWFPNRLDIANVVILYTGQIYKDPGAAPGVAFAVKPPVYFEELAAIMQNPGWRTVYFNHGWLVLKKGAVLDTPMQASAIKAVAEQIEIYKPVIEKYTRPE